MPFYHPVDNFSTPTERIWYTGNTMKRIVFLGIAAFLLYAVPIYAQLMNEVPQSPPPPLPSQRESGNSTTQQLFRIPTPTPKTLKRTDPSVPPSTDKLFITPGNFAAFWASITGKKFSAGGQTCVWKGRVPAYQACLNAPGRPLRLNDGYWETRLKECLTICTQNRIKKSECIAGKIVCTQLAKKCTQGETC